MRVLYMLCVVALVASCGPMTPEERGIEVSDRIGVFNQSKALFSAQIAVEDHYGIRLGGLHTDAVVYWTDTKCPKNGQYAVIYRGQCNYGRMWSIDEIYVALSNADPERTCGSALIHEFGHAMYMEMFIGDGNAAHDDDEFWGVLEAPMKLACDRGW